MNGYNIGSDPEIVIVRQATGLPVSAIEAMPDATKKTPRKIGKFEIFADNANLEMNLPPSATREQFIQTMRQALASAKGQLGSAYRLEAPASLHYPAATLDNDYCKLFGCEPDYNAWTLEINEIDAGSAAENTFRTCGGHLHVSPRGKYQFLLDDYGRVDTIKAMDVVLGVASVFLDNDPASIVRRNLYGAPGAHRPKDYGVEYRTLSNFWLRHPELTGWAYDMTGVALRMVEEKVLPKFEAGYDVVSAIKKGDINAATTIYNRVVDFYPEVASYTFNVNGLTSNKTKLQSLEGNWGL